MNSSRATQIESLLKAAFQPEALVLKDQSHLHAGHAGAEEGKSHFAVKITSRKFEDMSRLQRHRAIYAALGDMMQTDIHALTIDASTPEEAQS